MKTIISMLFMLFSLVGLQAVFAQNGKFVSFQIGNIPTKQGRFCFLRKMENMEWRMLRLLLLQSL